MKEKERKKIDQPNIPRPNEDDPLFWASLCRTHEKWLRHIAPQLGFDTNTLLLGDALSSIIGDDENSFGFFFMEEYAELIKKQILERMDWEIQLPETPEEIKVKLKDVTAFIKNLDFSKKENYSLGHTKWKEMRDWVEKEIENKPEWKAALPYSLEANKKWSPYWWEFLGKETFFRDQELL